MENIISMLTQLDTSIQVLIGVIGTIGLLLIAIVKVYKDIMNTINNKTILDELTNEATGMITTAAIKPEKVLKSISEATKKIHQTSVLDLNDLVTTSMIDKNAEKLKKIGLKDIIAVSGFVQSVYNGIKPAIKLLKKR